MTLEYGKLMVVENFHTDGETKKEVEFVFNPTKLDIGATAKWEQGTNAGNKKASVPVYKGPDPCSMDLDLVLDSWDRSGADRSKKRDVRKDVDTLIAWTRPTASTRTTKKPSSPLVCLHWGKPWFKCYVASVKATFTLFDEKGTPIRASVKVSLKEVPPDRPKQNPTSGSLAGHQSHLLVEGDSLPLVAFRYYDQTEYWRGLAIANGIDDPLRVRPGTRLLLPPIEDVAALSG